MNGGMWIKHPDTGEYVPLHELVWEFGTVVLKSIPTNNSIQCRDADGKWIGNVKYDFREGETDWHA